MYGWIHLTVLLRCHDLYQIRLLHSDCHEEKIKEYQFMADSDNIVV